MEAVKVDMPIELPSIPAPIKDFIPYLSSKTDTPIHDVVKPYVTFEAELRKVYAQQPQHEAIQDGLTNMVPIFAGHEESIRIQARDPASETEEAREKFIMPLRDENRKTNGTPAIVSSLKDFQTNFNLFSESSLVDLDWSNIVAAGSAVTTSLLPVPKEASGNKKALREYYHERLAPSSDVDLFIYGLNEEQAIKKMQDIEESIKGSILYETTTIRTKNCITIASQYPVRHVQVVLRLYTSISEIITGFDVDCACAAYNGKQVYASPRAIVAFMTQSNVVDLTRRSPSYENRLSKYSHRGFEIWCPPLDRTRIDPTIFERSFTRTQGLARLLVLEKLPKTLDRENYMDQRRRERGRPAADRTFRNRRRLNGNLKDDAEDEVAEWISEEEISSYTTLTVPYGKRFNSTNITRLLYNQDLLLNSEWNKPKDREVNLHRHPCFFGKVTDIVEDCCGDCPVPVTEEEVEVAAEESKRFISGKLSFLTDDPGRQEIGSFRPLTDDDWTEMAYVGNTERLCQAIVNGEADHVRDWCEQDGIDVNCRDYTGKTPLQLATQCSTVEIVQILVDHGARLISRLVDGRTALHIAAARGDVDIIKVLMQKSLANEEEEDTRKAKEKDSKKAQIASPTADKMDIDTDEDFEIHTDKDSDSDDVTMGSFIKIANGKAETPVRELPEDNSEDPDIYDINVLAWDTGASPLHLAILCGQVDAIRLLVSEYGADALLPIKLAERHYQTNSAILTLVLAITLPAEKASEVAKLLLELGATSGQATVKHFTALHFIVAQGNVEILKTLFEYDAPAAKSVLNHVAWTSGAVTPLMTAALNRDARMVKELLDRGANPELKFEDWIKANLQHNHWTRQNTSERNLADYHRFVSQPLKLAIANNMFSCAKELLEHGADPCLLDKHLGETAPSTGLFGMQGIQVHGRTVLDIVQQEIEAINKYKEPVFTWSEEPEHLRDEAHYTAGYTGYQLWTASCDYHEKNLHLEGQRKKWHETNIKAEENSKLGVEEKARALDKLKKDLEGLETLLIAGGAKTYKELFPNVDDAPSLPVVYPQKKHERKPWMVRFGFKSPDITPEKKNGYVRLFEACWANNIEIVKEMTLGPWGYTDPKQLPLPIIIQDNNGFNPYIIAIMRGHYQLADQILNIALAQYQPKEESTHLRWAITAAEDSEDESEAVNIYSELVDERFTVDDVGAVSNVVKSQLRPQLLLDHFAKLGRFDNEKQSFRFNSTLMARAIQKNNTELFDIVLKASVAQSKHFLETYEISDTHFVAATKKGRTTMLGEMIRLTGFGIPINNLVKCSGIEIKPKKQHYQGLSVGGRKRADWAAEAGGAQPGPRFENITPPVLRAAYIGNIETLEWFMSGSPLRKYREWAESNKEDQRVQSLEDGKGFENTVSIFLRTRNEYIFHMAILCYRNHKKTDLDLLKHILRIDPDALDRPTITEALSPLHLAIRIQRADIVAFLIVRGANQRCRDNASHNCVHHMLLPHKVQTGFAAIQTKTAPLLKEMLGHFDPKIVKELLLSRTQQAAQTPLAFFLSRNTQELDSSVIEIFAGYSNGEDLDMIDNSGDLPLHIACKKSFPTQVQTLITLRPSTLFRENATGRTPLEMMHDLYIQDRVTTFPNEGLGPSSSVQYTQTLLNRPASDFVKRKNDSTFTGEAKSVKRTWEVCAKAAQVPLKRRLVSLFEASEVAKRLGGQGFAVVPSANIVDDHEPDAAVGLPVQDEVGHYLYFHRD